MHKHMKYNKLIRDKIPEIIRANGDTPHSHIADEAEYAAKLREKLREETEEYLSDYNPDELADILEVIRALCQIHNCSWETIENKRQAKASARGGFDKRIILESS